MFNLLTLVVLSTQPALASDSTCDKVTSEWLRSLEEGGCPPLGKMATRMKTACMEVNTASWNRDQKSARKRFWADCQPTPQGFAGVLAPIGDDGRTISHCGRLVHRVRGDRAEAPVPEELDAASGFDKVIGITAAAGFACSQPAKIDQCSLPTSIHTAMDQLLVQEETCKQVQEYPLDSTLWAVGLLSGAMPIDPFAREDHVRALISEKTALQEKRKNEAQAFEQARTDELVRAKAFAADCLVPPANMHEPDQAGRAHLACDNLLSLWRGDDEVRQGQEASGTIPDKHANMLAGKVLNSESLQVSNFDRVNDRATMLKEHQEYLIKKNFPEVLDEQGAAAGQAYLVKYAPLLNEEWAKDAQDRVLERERKEAALLKKKKK